MKADPQSAEDMRAKLEDARSTSKTTSRWSWQVRTCHECMLVYNGCTNRRGEVHDHVFRGDSAVKRRTIAVGHWTLIALLVGGNH